MDKLVLVAGATGGTGQQIVNKLIAKEYKVRVLVRDLETARQKLGDAVDLFVGDVTVPPTLPAAFRDVDLFVSAIGSRAVAGLGVPEEIDYGGIKNLTDVAKATGVDHYVLVSSLGVTHPDHALNQYGNVLTWKLRGEDYLRRSGIPYTIVRPGGLTDADATGKIQFGQGDTISGRIPRADVGDVVVEILDYPPAHGVTVELISGDEPTDDIRAAFDSLKKDEGALTE